MIGVNTAFTPTLGPPGEVNVVPPDVTLIDIPTYSGRDFVVPNVPTQNALTSINIPPLPTFPVDHTGSQPDFQSPDTPAGIPLFAGSVPTLDDIGDIDDLNVASLLSGIAAPVPATISLPTAPTVVLPAFTATRPGDAPDAPTDLPAQLQSAYIYARSIMPVTASGNADALFTRWFPNHSVGLAALESRLLSYLNGNFDFDDEIADAITELARNQVNAEYIRNEQDAANGPGKRGFTYPDAVFLAQITGGASKRADANARSAMDLRKVRFDYQQKMLELAITQSKELRLGAMQIYVNVFQTFAVLNGQCIDYAKTVLQAAVEVFNAEVKSYEATLEGYKAEAEVYKARVTAALAVLEVYKAQIEAEKLKVDVNEQLVRVYEARLKAVQIYADVWKTKADVIAVKANLQRLKFDAYTARIQGYAAQVNAKEAEYRGYAAQIGGQVALQNAWAERVKARTAEIEGYKAHVEALAEQTKVLLAYNESVTRQFESAVRAFQAESEAERSVIETDISSYRALTEGISKQNESIGRVADLKLKEWETGKQVSLKRADQSIERARAEAMVKIENLKVQVEIASQIGHNLSAMAQAALAGINSVLSKAVSATGTA